jgi:hypothetical protein
MSFKRFIKVTLQDDSTVVLNIDYIKNIQPDVVAGPEGSMITFSYSGHGENEKNANGRLTPHILFVKESPDFLMGMANS